MDITMGSDSNLVTGIIGYMFQKVRRHFSYVCHNKRRVSNFENQVETLREKRDRVLRDVDAAEKNGENVHTDVKSWLIKANDLINSGEKAEADAGAFDELLRQGGFHKVSYRNVPHAVINASPKDYEAFGSRKQLLADIIEAVKDPKVNIIGVYGMAGIGKTTLVKEVVRQVKENKLFDSVVMAAVTQTLSRPICRHVGIEIRGAELDPTEVGIPFGEEHHGCTILLSSRDLYVLSKGMDANTSFAVGVLKQEVWDLFKKIAGDGVESPDLWPIATKAAKKCSGLPVAIKALAKTLRNQPSFVWEDALRQLNKPSTSNFRGVPAEAYSAASTRWKKAAKKCSGLPVAIKALAKTLRINLHWRQHGGRDAEQTIDGAESSQSLLLMESNEKLGKISMWKANVSKLPDHLKCPKLTFFFYDLQSLMPTSSKRPSFENLQRLASAYLIMDRVSPATVLTLEGMQSSLAFAPERRFDFHVSTGNGPFQPKAQNLASLIIEGCADLKHVLSHSMAEYLQQLKYLEISNCKCIQEIIPADEITKEAFRDRAPIPFPLLNSLIIKGLDKLKRFCHEDYKVEFPSMTILEKKNCPELKGFIYKSMSQDIPVMEFVQ
ncbi:hypothetical protein F3Y22_tig00117007pilonHSYRG00054 [Hibiscus syriacus]|uniref:NB-ARC domain-containing protein n=1 Tax=Hibiscus syriacus TaxID=106335 RepID=A0A6A2X2M3_HIBSY|nr:hypothetical protein F3Y22_tig00117007pilonHSYRG00054 [Hibiscus syriacus]